MKLIKALLGNLWKFYFLLVLSLTLLLLYPAYYFLLLNENYFQKGFQLIRFQTKLILFLVGIRPKVEGSIPDDEQTSYIICPNHSSYLDILLLYYCLPHYFIFLGKEELGKVPVFNIFFKRMNILVNRSNPKAAHEAIKKACERIEKGNNIVIFPEGTIPNTAPRMKPFKNGAFKVAQELKISIIPISFRDNYKLLEDSMKFNARCCVGTARVYIHPPILAEEHSELDLVSLREKTKAIIASKLD